VNSAHTPFQILSLDGGGIRGLFSAAMLAAVEDDLKTSIADHFDLIAGTSTGGIIAIALGLGMKPREVVEFYLQNGPAVFRNPLRVRSALQFIRRKYSQAPIAAALRTVLGDRLFGDSLKRLVIPSYNVGADDVYVFRTAHADRLKRDYRVPAWKVALATAAAPTFFPAVRDVDRLRLIDGGVWANNPAMVALVEAFATLSVPLEATSVLSIGTYDAVASRPARLDHGGILAWARGGAVVDVLMRAQSIGVNNQVRFLLGEDRHLRIDPKVPAADVALDRIRDVDELIGRAAHYSRTFMPLIEKRFCAHKAAPFVPLHRP
jgi:patatin-like phospholipase/acyl hydrolase